MDLCMCRDLCAQSTRKGPQNGWAGQVKTDREGCGLYIGVIALD